MNVIVDHFGFIRKRNTNNCYRVNTVSEHALLFRSKYRYDLEKGEACAQRRESCVWKWALSVQPPVSYTVCKLYRTKDHSHLVHCVRQCAVQASSHRNAG